MSNLRFSKRAVFKNINPLYEKKFLDKGVRFIAQVDTAKFTYPDVKDIETLDKTLHVWKQGDSFDKISIRY